MILIISRKLQLIEFLEKQKPLGRIPAGGFCEINFYNDNFIPGPMVELM